MRSWESLAYLQLCSGSAAGRWWKPCSYRLAAQWQRSCLQWVPRCSAGVCWVVGHLRQHFCCRALRRAYHDPSQLNTSSASSSDCFRGDRFGKHFKKCRNREGHVKVYVLLPRSEVLYLQIPNLVSGGVLKAKLITLCFILADDLHNDNA